MTDGLAGIGERGAPIEENSAADWERVIAVNLTGAFQGLKHAAREMKKAGRGGVIVNMASVLGLVAFSGSPAYTAAKHGFIRTPLISGIEATLRRKC